MQNGQTTPNVSTLRHQFDKTAQSHIHDQYNNQKHLVGTNVNRLKTVYDDISSEKRQKLNDHEHLSRFNKILENTKPSKSDSYRSRSLSTPRLSGSHTKYNNDFHRNVDNSESLKQQQQANKQTSILAADALTKNVTDHVSRFQSAKALFARIEEEAKLAKQQQIMQQRSNLKAFNRLSVNFLAQSQSSPPDQALADHHHQQLMAPTATPIVAMSDLHAKRKPTNQHLDHQTDDNKENQQFGYRTKPNSFDNSIQQPKRHSWTKSFSNPTSPTKPNSIMFTGSNSNDLINSSPTRTTCMHNTDAQMQNSPMSTNSVGSLTTDACMPYSMASETKTPPTTPYNIINNDLIKNHQLTLDDVSSQIVTESITNSRRSLFGKHSP
jgi:hypothetical protein